MHKTVSPSRKSILLLGLFVFLISVILFRVTSRPFFANAGWIMLNKEMDDAGEGNELGYGRLILENVLEGERKQRYSYLVDAYLDPGNLVENGSFEFSQNDWTILGVDGVLPQITDSLAYKGKQSLEISFSGKDVNFYQAFQEVNVTPGACYLLQAHTKTQNLTDGVALEIWDAEGGYQNWYGGRTSLVQGTTNWRPVDLQFCVADDVEIIQVRIRRYGGKGQPVSGTIWIDNVLLSALSGSR